MISGLCHSMVTELMRPQIFCPETVHRAACCLNTHCKEQSCIGCQSSARRDFNIIECDEPSRGPPGRDCYLHHLGTFSKPAKITVRSLEMKLLCYTYFVHCSFLFKKKSKLQARKNPLLSTLTMVKKIK